MHVQASLQKDALPFGYALGLSLATLIPASFRLWGCWRMPLRNNWLCLICSLSLVGSSGLFIIVVSKVHEKHRDPYLGLILANSAVLASYEVQRFLLLCAQIRKLKLACFLVLRCIGVLTPVGFVLCFFEAVPSWIWLSLLFSTSAIYVFVPLGYYYLIRLARLHSIRYLLWTFLIPCPFVLVFTSFIHEDRLVLPAWVFYAASSFCTIRFQIITLLGGGKLFGYIKSISTFYGDLVPQNSLNQDLEVTPVPTQPEYYIADPLQSWERGVLELLRSTKDLGLIRTICRLPLNQDILQDVLSQRWDPELDSYLMSLRVEVRRHKKEILEWDRDCRAKEFLRQVLPTSRKPPPVWDWNWDTFNYIAKGQNPSQIAINISDLLNTSVLKVSFREWAGCAFGYEEYGVTSFLSGVEHTRTLLYQRLQDFDPHRATCELVAQELRSQDPLACWLFSSSLGHHDRRPISAIESFLDSIRDIFTCKDPSVLVRRFAFLETRFAIMAEDGGNWRDFLFDVSFLERITYEDPRILAESITHTDKCFFLGLTSRDFEETKADTLLCPLDSMQSSALANDIVACLATDRHLLERIVQLVEYLHRWRNYKSEGAILAGLQKAQICPAELSRLFEVFNPKNVYASYLNLWSQEHGIPYLLAHLKSRTLNPANLSDFLPSTSPGSTMPTQETIPSSHLIRLPQKPEGPTQEQNRPLVYREIRMRMRIFCCYCQAITGWWEGQCLKCSHEGCSDCLFTQRESIERDADSATTQVKLNQIITKARAELGWILADARPYFGVQRGSKHTTIGPLLPLATNHDLQEWISFLQGNRWRKEDIEKAGYSKAACSYVKLYRDGQSDI